jgi:hypothetical protein
MAADDTFWHKILIWSYGRGTIPYDIICVLILAFIFLTPKSCFQRAERGAAAPNPSIQSGPAAQAAR